MKKILMFILATMLSMNVDAQQGVVLRFGNGADFHVNSADTVTGIQSNKISTAWQNIANSTNWTWASDGKQITLTGYTGPNEVVVPDMLDGLPVTGFGTVFSPSLQGRNIKSISGGNNVKSIANDAFVNCQSLISVSFPSVTVVGERAFLSCGLLHDVLLPYAITIGASSFSGCSDLHSISLSSAITIGASAFSSCSYLYSISLLSAITIGDNAFSTCDSLNSIYLPSATSIGNWVFSDCTSLTSIDLPEVITIGAYAFSDSYLLSSVSLPSAVTISDYAFNNCTALNAVYFSKNPPSLGEDIFYGILANQVSCYVTSPTASNWGTTLGRMPVIRLALYGDGSALIGIPNGFATNAVYSLISGVSSNSITSTNAYTVIGIQSNLIAKSWQNPVDSTNWTWTSDGKQITITGYTGLQNVVIPDVLDGLPVTGFGTVLQNHSNITNVNGGAYVVSIPSYAFAGCSSLKNIAMQSITDIGASAFVGCVALQRVSFPATVVLGTSAFLGCQSLVFVNLPSVTYVYNCFTSCSHLENLSLPSALTVGSSFVGCSSLTNVSLPVAVTLESYAFENCSSLISVDIPLAVYVGDYSFHNCSSIKSLILPNAKYLGFSAFSGCQSLTDVYLPSVISVNESGFSNCGSLTNMVFGQNAPLETNDVFLAVASNQVSIVVDNPTAAEWRDTWNGMPVVRKTVYGSNISSAFATNSLYSQISAFSTNSFGVIGIQSNLISSALQPLDLETNKVMILWGTNQYIDGNANVWRQEFSNTYYYVVYGNNTSFSPTNGTVFRFTGETNYTTQYTYHSIFYGDLSWTEKWLGTNKSNYSQGWFIPNEWYGWYSGGTYPDGFGVFDGSLEDDTLYLSIFTNQVTIYVLSDSLAYKSDVVSQLQNKVDSNYGTSTNQILVNAFASGGNISTTNDIFSVKTNLEYKINSETISEGGNVYFITNNPTLNIKYSSVSETSSNSLYSSVSGNSSNSYVVVGYQSNLISSAWQNPASAADWTWTSDGKEITLTGYNFSSMDVVFPDTLDGLPVTGFDTCIFAPSPDGTPITTVSGGANILSIPDSAFYSCANLTSVKLYSVTSIGNYAFNGCMSLHAVFFSGNAPPDAACYSGVSDNQVTNYVINPIATGWGSTWSGMPVVRTPISADSITLLGTEFTGETWSYSDHTNWMEVAGADWVDDLILGWWFYERANWVAADDLNPILHPDPLPQYLLKANAFNTTNAVLVNPTLDGGNVSGDTLIGAEEVTNIALSLSQFIGTLYAVSNASSLIPGYMTLTNQPATDALVTLQTNSPALNSYPWSFAYPAERIRSIVAGQTVVRFFAWRENATASIKPTLALVCTNGAVITEYDMGPDIALPASVQAQPFIVSIPNTNTAASAGCSFSVRIKVVSVGSAPRIYLNLGDARQLSADVPVASGNYATISEVEKKLDSANGTATALTVSGSLGTSAVTGGVDLTSAAYVRAPVPSAGSDVATADWTRGLLSIGNPYYLTTNTIPVAFAPYSARLAQIPLPFDTSDSVSISSATNGQIIFAALQGEPFSGELRGPATVTMWLNVPTGSPSANYALTLKPLFGYTSDTNDANSIRWLSTNVAPVSVTAGATNEYIRTMSFDNRTVTNAYVCTFLKVVSKGSSAGPLKIMCGQTYSSRLLLRSVDTSSLGTRGATNMTVGAATVPYSDATRTFDATGVLVPVTGGTLTNATLSGITRIGGVWMFGTNAPVVGDYPGWCSGRGLWTNGVDHGVWDSYDACSNLWWELLK